MDTLCQNQTKVKGSVVDHATFDEEVHLWHMIMGL